MPNGSSPTRPRTTGVFSGLLLIVFGFLILLHNYGHLQLGGIFKHWWPLIFIFWGATKLYERTLAQRQGRSAGWITPGEVFLVIGLMIVVLGVIAVEEAPHLFEGLDINFGGEPYSFPIDIDPQPIAPNARILIRGGRGTITVRSSDEPTLHITGQKAIRTFSEADAQKRSAPIEIQAVKVVDGYEIHPGGFDLGDSRISVDMDVVVPKKSTVIVHNERGDVNISDMANDVTVSTQQGDIEINDTTGNVDVTLQKGDVKATDTKGDVKVSGHGGSVEVVDVSGSLTVDGEFYSSVRADKIAKGVRFISQRSDLTLTQLGGHFEKTSGNLEIADAPGNLTSRTKNVSVSLENVTGRIVLDNINGAIELQFSNAPKEDITISNERASVTLSIPSSSSFDIQADCRSCDIDSEFTGSGLKATRTEKGDSHLEGKYGSARGPRIILKSSYDSIQIRKTT
jgi:cell wall-active antibiotic response 4TMS protein YvqF